ncbi:MAG TPA: hypothetical protein VG099_11345 [Gemmataceae bacterium]|jgi:hypothetical protein|nr:hypothetical protein [Gemmataceae bacterium]
MELEVESGKIIKDATEADILCQIAAEDFAILSADPDTYLQCAKDRKAVGQYALERQDGSLQEHYRAVDKPITLERVQTAFCKYLRQDPSWRGDFQWEHMRL